MGNTNKKREAKSITTLKPEDLAYLDEAYAKVSGEIPAKEDLDKMIKLEDRMILVKSSIQNTENEDPYVSPKPLGDDTPPSLGEMILLSRIAKAVREELTKKERVWLVQDLAASLVED